MDEAQYLADRVAIVDRGAIVCLGSPKELIQRYFSKSKILSFKIEKHTKEQDLIHALRQYGEVKQYHSRYEILVDDATDQMNQLTGLASQIGVNVQSALVRTVNLEDVFLSQTGRSISHVS